VSHKCHLCCLLLQFLNIKFHENPFKVNSLRTVANSAQISYVTSQNTFPSTLLSNTMTHFLHGTKCKVMLTKKTTRRSALNLAWNVRPVRRANLTTLREKSLPPSSEFLHHSDGRSRLLRSTERYLPAYKLPVQIRENSESGIEITTSNLS
jgi:hypothetical protein